MRKNGTKVPEEAEVPEGEVPVWVQWVLVAIALGLAVWFGLDFFWM